MSNIVERLRRNPRGAAFELEHECADEIERLRAEVEALCEELADVLSDWNAAIAASGSKTNGGAIGHIASLRQDAERYRYIRDNHETRGRAMEIVYGLNGTDWDAAIDAALAKERL